VTPSNSVDRTCAVRDRDQRQVELWVVAPFNDQQIAVVQACSLYPHAHLTRTGLWRRPFNKGEVVKTELAGNLEGPHGCPSLNRVQDA